MINGSPLDDARTLTQRYDKLRQEAEAQVRKVHYLSDSFFHNNRIISEWSSI